MNNETYLKLYRKCMDNELFTEKPFDRWHAFEYMMLKAYRYPRDAVIKGQIVHIDTGQFIMSQRKMAETFGWSINKFIRFRKLLEQLNMVTFDGDTYGDSIGTLVTIVNYKAFQVKEEVDGDTNEDSRVDTRENTCGDTNGDNIKKDKKDKKDKNNNMSATSRDKSPAYPYGEIIDYLNLKAGTRYRATSEDTRKHIRQRFREGRTVDDFKAVIDKKCEEWKGTEWEKFLRPATLFGSKFESYLNQRQSDKKETGKANKFCQFPQREYDYDDLERKLLRK